jgi:outer membrane biogenesis lipoprotein LolB
MKAIAMSRSQFSFTVVALACALLTGCAVGPDYQRPDAPVPKAFKEASEDMPAWTGDWKTAEPQDIMARPTGGACSTIPCSTR